MAHKFFNYFTIVIITILVFFSCSLGIDDLTTEMDMNSTEDSRCGHGYHGHYSDDINWGGIIYDENAIISDEALADIEEARNFFSELLLLPSLEEMRAYFIDWADQTFPKIPKNVKFQTFTINGIECEYIRSPGAKKNKIGLYFHGGGYSLEDASVYRYSNYKISKEARISILAPNYGLAPENPFPGPIEDCLSIYEYLLENGYKSENIVFIGDSAGGNAVFTVMMLAKQKGLPLPAAGVAISPWIDLTHTIGDSMISNLGKDPFMGGGKFVLDQFTFLYTLGMVDPTEPLASPIFNDDFSYFPPMYITIGDIETILDAAIVMYNNLKDDNVEVTLEIGHDLMHVWPTVCAHSPEAKDTIERIGMFIKKELFHKKR